MRLLSITLSLALLGCSGKEKKPEPLPAPPPVGTAQMVPVTNVVQRVITHESDIARVESGRQFLLEGGHIVVSDRPHEHAIDCEHCSGGCPTFTDGALAVPPGGHR